MNKSESPLRRALGQYFRSTTLHGFKYLSSRFYFDRIGWVLCCCASTCCAGILFAVIWQRFLQVPAVLELHEMRDGPLAQHMPLVAVCPPVQSYSSPFFEQLNINASISNQLSETIRRILAGKPATEYHIQNLEKVLSSQNMTLTRLMLKYSPACEDLMVNCRWQSVMVPCKYLFEKELSDFNVCCIMRPEKAYQKLINASTQLTHQFEQSRALDLSMQCSSKSMFVCKFYTKYDDASSMETILAPGYIYFAQLLFSSVPMTSAEQLLASDCISDENYSKQECLYNCAEKRCGCLGPLRIEIDEENSSLPACNLTQLACLRSFGAQEDTCKCLPSCHKITPDVNLESSSLNLDTFVVDPFYLGLNSKSTVIYMQLNIPLSRIFTLNPTETWATLLSSLGGVFNMFLGVGLFSILEIIFLLLVTMPSVIIKSLFR